MEEQRVMFMDIPSVPISRSISPMSPSPNRDRGFFEAISRRFVRRSHDDNCYQNHGEEDSRSSSTDSCSSASDRLPVNNNTKKHNSNLEISCSSDSSNSSNSAGNSNTQSRSQRRASSSIRQTLKCISLSSRSLSCSNSAETKESAKQKTKTKKSPAPKRILRQPISYTYLKGMSGLPTQRVPRSAVCCHYSAHR